MESQISGFILFLVCVFGVSAAPVKDTQDKINHFVELLGKMRSVERSRRTVPPLTSFRSTNPAKTTSDFSNLPDSESADDAFEIEDSLESGFLGGPIVPASKRQGGWSYDYGLGGGRFGKRHYGDYGIGGGRFGRDVDHVDLSDGNDADLVS